MKIPSIFWLQYSSFVLKICYIHTGWDDRSLLWIVEGKLMDVCFIKIN